MGRTVTVPVTDVVAVAPAEDVVAVGSTWASIEGRALRGEKVAIANKETTSKAQNTVRNHTRRVPRAPTLIKFGILESLCSNQTIFRAVFGSVYNPILYHAFAGACKDMGIYLLIFANGPGYLPYALITRK